MFYMQPNFDVDIERMIKSKVTKDDFRVHAMRIRECLEHMDRQCDELRSLMVEGYDKYPHELDDMAVKFSDLSSDIAWLKIAINEKII